MLRQLMLSYDIVAKVFWWGGPVMGFLLLWQAKRRRLWGVCPAFFVYTAFQVVKFAVLIALLHHRKPYFVVYWVSELMDAGLVVAVLYRLYSNLFSGYEGLRALQDALFRWAAGISILIAVVVAAGIQENEASRLMAGVLAFDVGVAILKAGLIAFVFVISTTLSLRWGHYAFAVLVGMSLYTSVELAAAVVRLQMGAAASQPYRLIKPAAYMCALLVWVAYFFTKERKNAPLTIVPGNDLASWNEALLQLIGK